MTEAEWHASESSVQMIWLTQKSFPDRKGRLFASACLRRIAGLFPGPKTHNAIEVLERYADGNATADELSQARADAEQEAYEVQDGGQRHQSQDAAIAAAQDDIQQVAHWAAEATATTEVGSEPEEVAQAAIVREIYGTLCFRPVTFNPAWRTSTVLALAKQMYDSRDFTPMPVLADALQDAGCENADILNHCRGDSPHVRGCWVVDLILGKE